MSATGLGSRAIIGRFYKTLNVSRPAWIDAVSFRSDSDQESETYKFLGMTPALREWVGGRQAKGLRENGITIVNKPFEATLKVTRRERRRDKTGQIMARVDDLAKRAAAHPGSLISTLILGGHNTVCYDGQYFFDTDHTEGENTTSQSNDIGYDISDGGAGGTAAFPTQLSMQRAILAAVAQMMGFKDDQNEPLNEDAAQFLVMTPPSLYPQAAAACAVPALDAGASNALVAQKDFSITAVGNARLSSWTDKFCVFRTDGGVKAFIDQVEEETRVDAVAEGSELEFNTGEHHYGVTREGNAGYGMWQHACRVTLAA